MMTQIASHILLASILLGTSGIPSAQNATATDPRPIAYPALKQFSIDPGSRFWVKGSSTVRDFECQVMAFRAQSAIHVDTPIQIERLDHAMADVVLEIPVADLNCRNGTMNDHMRKALRADHHPNIQYRHVAHKVVFEDGQPKLQLEGRLSISGEERSVVLLADVEAVSDEALSLRGSHVLDMTEFGVSPPKLMLGTLKVHDIVTIHFDLILRP